jgi:hypothetical protein
METFLTGLFWDQRCRVEAMLTHLPAGDDAAALPPTFLHETREMLLSLTQNIDNLLAKRELGFPDLRIKHVKSYSRWSERLTIAEFRCMVIDRFGTREKSFGRVLSRIYTEIGLTQPLPMVSFISNPEDYYWAHCLLGLIGAPIEEERHLINWPDLYHEIGHFIFHEYGEFLLGQGKIKGLVEDHFRSHIERAKETGRRKAADAWREKQRQWRDHWLMEFTCDLIATYLTGRAYAWSNFRISSIISEAQNIYSSHSLHPPNEARMRAIFLMLNRCGWTETEIAPLRQPWDTHANSGLNPIPTNYRHHTPDHILDELVNCVYDECVAIGLCSYHQQLTRPTQPVAGLLDEAWQTLLTNPTRYGIWEADQIRQLRATARQSL